MDTAQTVRSSLGVKTIFLPHLLKQTFAYTHTGIRLTVAKSILCGNTDVQLLASDKAML